MAGVPCYKTGRSRNTPATPNPTQRCPPGQGQPDARSGLIRIRSERRTGYRSAERAPDPQPRPPMARLRGCDPQTLDRRAGRWCVGSPHRLRIQRYFRPSYFNCLSQRTDHHLSATHPDGYHPSAYRGRASCTTRPTRASRAAPGGTSTSPTGPRHTRKLHSIAPKRHSRRRWRRDDHRAHYCGHHRQTAGPLQDHNTLLQRRRGQRRHSSHHLLDRSAHTRLPHSSGRVDDLGTDLRHPVHAAVARHSGVLLAC